MSLSLAAPQPGRHADADGIGDTGGTAGAGLIPELRMDGRWDRPLLRVHEDRLTARAAFDTVLTPMQLPVSFASASKTSNEASNPTPRALR